MICPLNARNPIISYTRSKRKEVDVMLHFPGVSEEVFDFEAEWLVKATDDGQNQVLFEGQGKNSDLELVLNYQDNPDQFEELAVGELIHLPKELFLVTETKPYKPKYECF